MIRSGSAKKHSVVNEKLVPARGVLQHLFASAHGLVENVGG